MLIQDHDLSIVRACRIARCSRTAWYRPGADRTDQDQPVIAALLALVERHSRWGFWLCYERLRAQGHGWNWKRVYRVYCALRLNLKRRRKKRVLLRPRLALEAPPVLNRTWALDFMGDTLYDGRCYRTLNVLDEGNREALAIEISTSLPSRRVVQLLEELVALHGVPTMLRCDNGPEFIAVALRDWCEAHAVHLHHIAPGKPNQNAFIERFNRTYRTEVLDAWVFTSLAEVRQVTRDWLELYNTERPHGSLGGVPPRTYLPRQNAA
jgi:putative transposase